MKVLPSFSVKAFYDFMVNTNFDIPIKYSWSQAAEDIALISIPDFPKVGKYLDVGANHPIRFSNTNLLYKLGWNGINIEPNPNLLKVLEKERPRDFNVQATIGKKSQKIMYFFSEDALSTADEERATSLIGEGRKLLKRMSVASIPLREIYDSYFLNIQCDLLSIDVEGLDLEVIKSLDLASLNHHRKPKYILIETQPPAKKVLASEISLYIEQFGYDLFLILPRASLYKFKQ